MATAPLSREIGDSETPGARWAAGKFWRGGKIAEDFEMEKTLGTIVDEGIGFIQRRADAARKGKPFFLYLALTAPHTPWLPKEEFRGRSGAGDYGDFVCQVDAEVARFLDELDALRLADNTLLVFSSDNGAFWIEDEIKQYGHRANGPFRGQKGDLHEGGHRMPFIVRWPGKVEAGAQSKALLCQTDLVRTFAAAAGSEVPEGAAEDSLDQLPVFLGKAKSVRETLIVQGSSGKLAARKGDWKFIPILGSGGFTQPRLEKPKPDGPKAQLYDLANDPAESKNLWGEKPAVAAELAALLDQ